MTGAPRTRSPADRSSAERAPVTRAGHLRAQLADAPWNPLAILLVAGASGSAINWLLLALDPGPADALRPLSAAHGLLFTWLSARAVRAGRRWGWPVLFVVGCGFLAALLASIRTLV